MNFKNNYTIIKSCLMNFLLQKVIRRMQFTKIYNHELKQQDCPFILNRDLLYLVHEDLISNHYLWHHFFLLILLLTSISNMKESIKMKSRAEMRRNYQQKCNMRAVLCTRFASRFSKFMGLSLQFSQYRICLQYRRPRFDPWVQKMPWRRAWLTTPVFLPEEFRGPEEPGELQSMELQRVGHD